jgi:hypothetical protein
VAKALTGQIFNETFLKVFKPVMPKSKYDEDEPFLFAISDIGASGRSLEEAQGSVDTTRAVDRSGEADVGRRGNRRGAALQVMLLGRKTLLSLFGAVLG